MSEWYDESLERLRTAARLSEQYYKKPLVVTTSGGKDSSVCVDLAIKAGINFEVIHNHTTADAPETVQFVRDEFRRLELMGIKCTINWPMYKGQRTSMWDLIPQKLMPPTRLVRYCCEVLKEHGGTGRFITTGVRWAESNTRKNNLGAFEQFHRGREKRIIINDNDPDRLLFENCSIKAKRVCNPIIDWEDEDVWHYIEEEHVPVNPLYADGFDRVGCIGCPLAGKRKREAEFERWSKYKVAYISAFDRMLKERRQRGKMQGTWNMGNTGTDVFNWWMEYDVLPGQMGMEEIV